MQEFLAFFCSIKEKFAAKNINVLAFTENKPWNAFNGFVWIFDKIEFFMGVFLKTMDVILIKL